MRTLAQIFSLLLIVTVVRAECPTPQTYYSWTGGPNVVLYEFPSAGPPPTCWNNESITALGIDSDIHAAFQQWTYAKQQQNTTGIVFNFTQQAPFRVYALSVTDPVSCPHSAADTMIGLYGGTSTVAVASTTFYLGSINSLGFANFDPTADNYHSFIQKLMDHEIGHTMGIFDQPGTDGVPCLGQTAGESYMNAACGTNDSANNMPVTPMLGIPDCDNVSVH